MPSSPEPSRLQWTQHRGRQILVCDLRDLDREGLLTSVEDYRLLGMRQPDRSLRMLVRIGTVDFHPETMTRARAIMFEVSPKVLRSAILGPPGILQVAIERFFDAAALMEQDVSGRGRTFGPDAESEALDWLAQD